MRKVSALDAEGDRMTELQHGGSEETRAQSEQQSTPSGETCRNPIVIELFVLVVLLIVLQVFNLDQRTR